MRFNWKKTLLVSLDVALAIYLVQAVTAFNKPDNRADVCSKVGIDIADENVNGFLSAQEIKRILERNRLYPLSQPMRNVDPRKIEEVLTGSPFVKTAECYKTQDGRVCITLTQRLPIVRIKNEKGEDYYLDDNGGIMPNSKYTSDLIVVTGYVPQWYAQHYIYLLAETLMTSDLWRNQVEQINVLPNRGIEIIPRVGNHIVFLGYLPEFKPAKKRKTEVPKFVEKKLNRLEKFYKYGLSQAGWNKYSYISLEFDNQIICKKRSETPPATEEKE